MIMFPLDSYIQYAFSTDAICLLGFVIGDQIHLIRANSNICELRNGCSVGVLQNNNNNSKEHYLWLVKIHALMSLKSILFFSAWPTATNAMGWKFSCIVECFWSSVKLQKLTSKKIYYSFFWKVPGLWHKLYSNGWLCIIRIVVYLLCLRLKETEQQLKQCKVALSHALDDLQQMK